MGLTWKALLAAPHNRYVIVDETQTLADAADALEQAGGGPGWMLAIRRRDGWSLVRYQGQDARSGKGTPLGHIAPALARTLQRSRTSPEQARAAAGREESRAIVILEGDSLLGIVSMPPGDAWPSERRLSLVAEAAKDLLEVRPDWAQALREPDRRSSFFLVDSGAGANMDLGEARHVGTLMPQRAPPPAGPFAGPEIGFEPYPRVDVPEVVPPGGRFVVAVGFGAAPQEGTRTSGRMRFPDASPGETCQVRLVTHGVDVEGPVAQPLALRMEAKAVFRCRLHPGVTVGRVHVEYERRGHLVGFSERAVVSEPAKRESPGDGAPMSIPVPDEGTDLEVVLHKFQGALVWTLRSSTVEVNPGPFHIEMEDPVGFAERLPKELSAHGYEGGAAHRLLESLGQRIADKMPPALFDALRRIHEATRRPPVVLLLTAETHVPWELALLDEPLKSDAPAFLATQTVLSRWILSDRIPSRPPRELTVRRVSAVAASYEGLRTLGTLEKALEERTYLKEAFGAATFDGTGPEVEKLLAVQEDGHLVHFALHGYASPKANESALLLADGSSYSGAALVGARRPGQPPRFCFLFLNACQVGQAGSSLGVAAGFPGDVLRGGTGGLVAPLWSIKDVDAFPFAISFYDATLASAKSVGEALHAERLRYADAGSTTRLAYIYYGHPLLRLKQTLVGA